MHANRAQFTVCSGLLTLRPWGHSMRALASASIHSICELGSPGAEHCRSVLEKQPICGLTVS